MLISIKVVVFELVYVSSCFMICIVSIPSHDIFYSHISHLCFLLLLSKDLSLTHFYSRSLSSLRMPYVCLFKFVSMLVLNLWIAFIYKFLFISISSLTKYSKSHPSLQDYNTLSLSLSLPLSLRRILKSIGAYCGMRIHVIFKYLTNRFRICPTGLIFFQHLLSKMVVQADNTVDYESFMESFQKTDIEASKKWLENMLQGVKSVSSRSVKIAPLSYEVVEGQIGAMVKAKSRKLIQVCFVFDMILI